MATYAKVDVRIWNDKKVRKLTPIPPCGQGVWIRLLTSEHRTTLPGVLCVGEAALAEELGWSLEAFREAFREAQNLGMVKADWKARFVWIPNACEYNRPESPNVVKSWRIPWDEAPECELKSEAYRTLKAFIEAFGEAFQQAFAQSCPQPSPNQEQEQEQYQEQRDPLPRDPGTTSTDVVPEQLAPSLASAGKAIEIAKQATAELSAKPEAEIASETVRANIRPRTAQDLILCLRVAVERAQPQNGLWNPGGSFAAKDARVFLDGFSDLEAALAEIEKKIEIFAKDASMAPWTVAKFSKVYNQIGRPPAPANQKGNERQFQAQQPHFWKPLPGVKA